MQAKVGSKMDDPVSGVSAIVVKAPDGASIVLRTGDVAVAIGKRYVCATCGSEVLVTKGGSADLSCHDKSMALGQPKLLPSSD